MIAQIPYGEHCPFIKQIGKINRDICKKCKYAKSLYRTFVECLGANVEFENKEDMSSEEFLSNKIGWENWTRFERQCFKAAKELVKDGNVVDTVMMEACLKGMRYIYGQIIGDNSEKQPKKLKITKGHFYTCIHDWSDDGWCKFCKGDTMLCEKDGCIIDGYGIEHRFGDLACVYFRDATPEEIASYKSEDKEN